MLSLLHIYRMLLLEFSVVELELLLGLDVVALAVEGFLHLVAETLLFILKDAELSLVTVLELFESLPVPALLTRQVFQLLTLTVHGKFGCLSCFL